MQRLPWIQRRVMINPALADNPAYVARVRFLRMVKLLRQAQAVAELVYPFASAMVETLERAFLSEPHVWRKIYARFPKLRFVYLGVELALRDIMADSPATELAEKIAEWIDEFLWRRSERYRAAAYWAYYRLYRYLYLWLLRAMKKRMMRYAIPWLRIEVQDVPRRIEIFYEASVWRRMPDNVKRRVLIATLNVLLGEMSLEHALKMVPEMQRYIMIAAYKLGIVTKPPHRYAIIIFPFLEEVAENARTLTLYYLVVPQRAVAADPYLGRSTNVLDLHVLVNRWKFIDEVFTISTKPSDFPEVALLLDELGEAILTDDYFSAGVLVTQTRTWKAVELGLPDAWWKLGYVGEVIQARSRAVLEPYELRRRWFMVFSRGVDYIMGLRW